MDRRAWLDAQRASVEERYDRLVSPSYEDDNPITATHRRFVEKVIESCPPGGAILDAACGHGRYFELVLAAGRRVVGIDQSAGMLARARTKHPEVVLEKVGLQELDCDGAFDAAMCIDAMEYICPEDWPRVLANLHRAVRCSGLIYLTVEQIDPAEIASVFAQATAEGLPVVFGENTRRGGGYHYYPTPDRVSRWLSSERLVIVAEGISRARSHGYVHILARGRLKTGRTTHIARAASSVRSNLCRPTSSSRISAGSGPSNSERRLESSVALPTSSRLPGRPCATSDGSSSRRTSSAFISSRPNPPRPFGSASSVPVSPANA
jgi:ubiquinone/menaquinone biosynthesis C-methylase UbiE